jgi:hypothetical protein
MVLLSGMMRSAAIYGDTDTYAGRIAGRQGGRWAQQTVRAAFPSLQHRQQPPDARLRELVDLRDRGIVSDAEVSALRARLRI